MYQDFNPWLLVRNDFIMAAGWGVDSTVSEVTRSGYKPATPHACVPPQSWPTMCAWSMPAVSSRATTSAAVSAVA